jgi:pimeloyl-ACP methyl ester carboxylesterase
MATFVLVHGTGCGSWIWSHLTPLLRERGHEVHAPTLTGVGDRAHLLHCGVNLTTHIDDVASLLVFEDLSDVVLVGHSYGGMVITGVATRQPERIGHLVYLDAYVPQDSQTEADLWPAAMRAEIERDEAASGGLRQPLPLDFLGITDPRMAAWVKARLTPHPLATYTEPVPAGGPASAALPRTFIHCTAGQTTPVFAPFAKRARADGWLVHELPTGHCAMLTLPNEVATLLLDLESTT